MHTTKDFFQHKASEYDKGKRRVANVQAIVDAVLANVTLDKKMHLMDFGAGTGLLLSGMAPYVRKITAIDVSKAMLDELAKKTDELKTKHDCELNIVSADLTVDDNPEVRMQGNHNQANQYDGVISSMTLHHIADIPHIFAQLKSLIKKGGFLALADLDTEAGDFHTQDTGVFHFGFDRDYLQEVAEKVGFKDIKIDTANEFEKNGVAYSVFLLTATA